MVSLATHLALLSCDVNHIRSIDVSTYSLCMPHVHLNNLLTATVSRYVTCFWDVRPHAMKCEQYEKDGKAYAERVGGSE